jgi:hypothetical protein
MPRFLLHCVLFVTVQAVLVGALLWRSHHPNRISPFAPAIPAALQDEGESR